jgi:cell division septation protein DedD
MEVQSEDAQSISDGAAGGAREEALFAWDYTNNEWPVLVGPKKQRSLAKLRVLVIIVLLASAAAAYFLFYQSASPGSPDAQRGSAVTEPHASAATSAPTDASSQPQLLSSDATATPESRPGQPTASEVKSPSGNEEARGRFSLQAAAFPTQASADEFAEKLKRVGVASYVVNADLARRGRWFRVRVGRFDTAEDAQRFGAEAQLRAKAVGLSLQLIVCQYEQP